MLVELGIYQHRSDKADRADLKHITRKGFTVNNIYTYEGFRN